MAIAISGRSIFWRRAAICGWSSSSVLSGFILTHVYGQGWRRFSRRDGYFQFLQRAADRGFIRCILFMLLVVLLC